MRKLLLLGLLSGALSLLPAAKNLELYFVDVEGGQATLIVAPSGQSMLVDTGWPGFSGRDAGRIAEVAKNAKVKQLDYVLITHFHIDHVGGVMQLVGKLPVKEFIDHGPSVEKGKEPDALYATYLKTIEGSKHTIVKPGDKIALKGVADITVVAANGEHISQPLPGAGQPNPACASATTKETDPSENARSVGFRLQFGDFKFVDLGDLTWNRENELACPVNLIGPVDLYLTTHHGLAQSNSPTIVQALHPKVAIMNNGAKKGGSAEAWQTVKSSPGLEDLWQLHYAVAGGKEHNVSDTEIANLEEQCAGNWLKVTVEPNGSFTVYNHRNKYEKHYSR